MLIEMPIRDYLAEAASGAETPGGGSVSALCAALGSAMGSMTAHFTAGKEKYAAVEEEIQGMLTTLAAQSEILMACVDEDAVAFGKIGAIYGMPKSTEEDKAARTAAMQAALGEAMAVPLRVMEAASAALAPLPRLAEVGNKNLITDTGVAAITLAAALEAAALNVAVNLKYMKDEARITETRARMEVLRTEAQSARDATLTLVQQAL